MKTNDKIEESGRKSGILLAIAVALIALCISVITWRHERSIPTRDASSFKSNESALTRIRRDGVLRVGWGGFPPYTELNPNEPDPNKRVQGFMIDVVNEIAKRAEPPLKVEWHLFQWETFRADLSSGKFDFIADPTYLTVGRALDFAPSDPISYFGIAIGVVRKDDNRFKTFTDLDQPGITIALAEGYTSSEYARAHLTKPTFLSVPVGQDAFVQLDAVLLGRADIALNDTPTVAQYVNAHKDKVKALWLNSPPAIVGGGFLARSEDRDLIAFLNDCIKILRADGTLNKFDEKWKTFGLFPENQLVPGKGLTQ